MSEPRQLSEPLSKAQMLLVVLTAILTAGVGYFEFATARIGYFKSQVQTPSRSLRFALPDEAIAIEPLLKGLMQAAPIVLLAATFCLAYASFRKPGHQRRRSLWTAFGLLLAAIAGIAAHQLLIYRAFIPAIDRGRFEEAQLVGTRTSLGEPAPDITVATIDGKTIQLADLLGKVVLLEFLSTRCEACDLQLPELQKIWSQFHANDAFWMLVIGRSESIESVQAFSAQRGCTFPLAADASRSGFNRFATEGIPRIYLISRDGKIIFQCQGHHQETMAALTVLLKAELARRD